MISMTVLMKNTKKNISIRMEILVKMTEGGFRGVMSPYPTVEIVCNDQQMPQFSQRYHQPGKVAIRSVPFVFGGLVYCTEQVQTEYVSQFYDYGYVLLIQKQQSIQKNMEDSHVRMNSIKIRSLTKRQSAQVYRCSYNLLWMSQSKAKIVLAQRQKNSFRKMRALVQDEAYMIKIITPSKSMVNEIPIQLWIIYFLVEIRYPIFWNSVLGLTMNVLMNITAMANQLKKSPAVVQVIKCLHQINHDRQRL